MFNIMQNANIKNQNHSLKFKILAFYIIILHFDILILISDVKRTTLIYPSQ